MSLHLVMEVTSDPRVDRPVYNPYGNVQGRRDQIYVTGRVISFPHHTLQHVNPPKDALTDDDTLISRGQWITSKVRKFMIVERYTHHCKSLNKIRCRGKFTIAVVAYKEMNI
jgi:hypothetical protein